MAFKTFFYAIVFSLLFFSCAEENEESQEEQKQEEQKTGSKLRTIKLSTVSNAAVNNNSQNSSNNITRNVNLDLSTIVTYKSGDVVPIEENVSDDMGADGFIKITTISGDSKSIKFSNSSDTEVYIVLTNDLAVPLSEFGLPESQSGNLKSAAKIYQRFNHWYYKASGNLIDLELNLSGDAVLNTISNDISRFEVHPLFIHFRKTDGKHYIYKFLDQSFTRLDSSFTASISNLTPGYSNTNGFNVEQFDYVFKQKDNCIIGQIRNSSNEAPYDILCVYENGDTKVSFSRPGLVDCYNEGNNGQWCYSGGSNSENISSSIGVCNLIEIGEGFLMCQDSINVYWELKNTERNQLELAEVGSWTQHRTTNQKYTYDAKYLYIISGNDGALKFSKIDPKTRTETTIDVSGYTKPNWMVSCNGVVDISIDDKFIKFNPSNDTIFFIDSNEVIEEYECME